MWVCVLVDREHTTINYDGQTIKIIEHWFTAVEVRCFAFRLFVCVSRAIGTFGVQMFRVWQRNLLLSMRINYASSRCLLSNTYSVPFQRTTETSSCEKIWSGRRAWHVHCSMATAEFHWRSFRRCSIKFYGQFSIVELPSPQPPRPSSPPNG